MEVVYEEGVYVGYRYFNSFNVKTSYPFGFGLSYTSFDYSNIKLSSPVFTESIKVQVTVKNTGKVSGKEVVQLYMAAPANKIDKPTEELKGFAKTKLLKPGETEVVYFTLDKKDLASFNKDQSSWVAEEGVYTIKIGNSSENFLLSGSFNLKNEIVVEKVSKALVPQVKINELKR